MMFHNFTFFEIKNAWGSHLVGFWSQSKKKIFFDWTLFRGRPPKFEISYRGKICGKSTVSLKRNEIESSARYQNLRNGRLPICSQYIFSR